MPNSNLHSNAHMVLPTLTDEAASKQLHELNADVINDIISLVGGEDAFYKLHEDVNKKGVEVLFEVLSDTKAVADTYHNHKTEILAFCRRAADCVGKNSITQLIAKNLGGDESEWLDEIGEALYTRREDLNLTDSRLDVILTCVIGIVVSELCSVFAEMQIGYED